MFELENRGELVEKIEDLVNRKRYTELRDLLLPMEPADIAILADDLMTRRRCLCCSACCRRSRPPRCSWSWRATSRSF